MLIKIAMKLFKLEIVILTRKLFLDLDPNLIEI